MDKSVALSCPSHFGGPGFETNSFSFSLSFFLSFSLRNERNDRIQNALKCAIAIGSRGGRGRGEGGELIHS